MRKEKRFNIKIDLPLWMFKIKITLLDGSQRRNLSQLFVFLTVQKSSFMVKILIVNKSSFDLPSYESNFAD